MMTFSAAVATCFKKYFTISGRATRAEYWWFHLLMYLVIGVFTTLAIITGSDGEGVCIGLMGIYIAVTIVPSFCVLVRRLHDTGRSGFNILWRIIPYVGSFIVFIFTLQASAEANEYGPKPLEDGTLPPLPETKSTPSEDTADIVETVDVEL